MAKLYDEHYRVTLKIVNKQCKGLQMLKDKGIDEYNLRDVRRLSGGLTRHLIRVSSNQSQKLPADVSIQTRRNNFVTAWIESDGCDVCNTILENGSFLVSGRYIRDYTIIYTFVSPTFDAYQNVVSTLDALGLKPKVLEMGRIRLNRTILTEKQEKTLWFALQMGFFDCPRKINTIELSHELGIATSTLSELVRRGIRRLLDHHFSDDET
jgi:predicted DNA binding protein